MRLSKDDAGLFYALWLPLLEYVNAKRNANPDLQKMKSANELDPLEVKKVADVLWADVNLIDEYLNDNKNIEGDNRELISGWKRCVSGRFILERILKKGAILISTGDEKVYQVSGIVSTWEEMFGFAHLPLMINATLIPFRDVIIPDGLIQTYNIIIGGNMARSFKDIYMEAKKNGQLYRKL